jgi:hypothetical protein
MARMLGEFFACKADEIDDTLVEEGPYGRFPTIEAKTVSSVSIATLGATLDVGTYDELVERIEGPQAAHGETGIDQVPGELRDALAASADLDAVAVRWGATDEMADWQATDVRKVIGDLSLLARQAREADQQLWFWWSL